ncbi:hypothetical protein L7F22_052187 [Adiantum nelumboides]|nr:hypothetical protein [Adiantum nelumboides]
MSQPASQVTSTVDFVANNLDKVSIQHGDGQHLHNECDNSSNCGEGSYSQSQEGCHSTLAFDQGVPSIHTVCPAEQPPQNKVGVGEMPSERSTGIELICSVKELNGLDKDANCGTGYDSEDGKDRSEDGKDSATEEDEDEDEQESDASDSSSSTSTLSFSSLSDVEESGHYRFMKHRNQEGEMEVESECEEGELRQSPSQKMKTSVKKKAVAESSEDEEGLKGPGRRNEMKDMPHIPKVSVTLQPYHTMVPAGFVSSAVGVSLIVEGTEGQPPLSEGSILWLTEVRLPLGIVDELFGPVKKPFYVVRYNDASELPEEAKEGAKVSYVREFADFVLNNPDLYTKAFDNTGENDEDLSDSEVYFSDDEKEAEYRRSKPRMKRGNSEVRIHDTDSRQHQEKGTQGKRSGKKNRHQMSRGNDSRTFPPNNDFSASRSPRQQNSSFQHRQGERGPPFQRHSRDTEPSYLYRQGEREPPFFRTGVEPTRKSNDQRFENRSPVCQRSLESFDVGRSKLLPPLCVVSGSDEVRAIPKQQVQVSMIDHLQASPRLMSLDVQSTQSNQSSESTSWEPQRPQMVVPQSQAWPVNQPLVSPNMASPQLHGMPHMPVCNAAVMVGPVSQVADTVCGLPTTSNVPIQSGVGLPMHQPTVFHSVPLQQQFSSFGTHQLSAQASSNMAAMQAAHTDGYSMGVAAFSAPVLGIPLASAPSNYVVHNQPCSGFTAVCSPPYGNGSPLTYGVPDRSQPMQQPMQPSISAASWQQQNLSQHAPMQPSTGTSAGFWQQQNLSQHAPMQQPMQPSTGTSAGSWQQQNLTQHVPWQKRNQQRPHRGRAVYRGPRF